MAESDNSTVYVLSEIRCKNCDGDVWVRPKKDGKPTRYQKYCSYECTPTAAIEKARDRSGRKRKNKHLKILRTYLPRVCDICGDVYMPIGSKSQYCGPECREKRYQQKLDAARKGPNKTSLECHECGSTYVPKQISKGLTGNKYCSQLCKQRAKHRKRQQKPGWHSYTCKECGKPFTTKRTDSVYCGDKCKGKGVARIRKERAPVMLPRYSQVYQVKCPACGDKRMSRTGRS